jgi:hypothetical protein
VPNPTSTNTQTWGTAGLLLSNADIQDKLKGGSCSPSWHAWFHGIPLNEKIIVEQSMNFSPCERYMIVQGVAIKIQLQEISTCQFYILIYGPCNVCWPKLEQGQDTFRCADDIHPLVLGEQSVSNAM